MTRTDRMASGTIGRASQVLVTVLVLLVVAGGCGADDEAAGPLLLAGPTTDIVVAIPTGWHQVINSANPILPQMVAPTNCLGRNEVACATGLARIATTTAPTAEVAAEGVRNAVSTAPGVTPGSSLSRGPARLAQRDGYRHRFTFSNQGGPLTAEVAALPTGAAAPDPQGNRSFSVVLVWLTTKPGAPAVEVIDEVVDSVNVLEAGR
ncbi:hypothetical protein [Actinomycetospora sp. CA-084318]|uniref:hypothetical protein n=1 Tax=Actinomycetospora sp. CA-084318 TaxID=3239892 RepID=UPI003D97751F